jgi:hypothetical protein
MLLHRPIRDQTQTNLRRTARQRWLPMSAPLLGCVKTPFRSESPYASNPHSAQQPNYPVLTAMSCPDASPTPAAAVRRGARHAGVRETCTVAVMWSVWRFSSSKRTPQANNVSDGDDRGAADIHSGSPAWRSTVANLVKSFGWRSSMKISSRPEIRSEGSDANNFFTALWASTGLPMS